MANEKKVAGVYGGAPFHMVGDGFRVSNYFPSGNDFGAKMSPFFLFDYHAPHVYAPTDRARGVGSHPHRGFETVTIAFEGSIAHHDSAGNAGVIGPGDVQWMTAASGVLHKEYHEREFSRRGGSMHMAQIWVNLPRAHKMDPPRYQGIEARQIARVELENGGGSVRIIAGKFRGAEGPAKTFTPLNLWEVRLEPQGRLEASFPARENTGVLVMSGEILVNGSTRAKRGDFVLFENAGEDLVLEGTHAAHLLLLNGEPIDEPVFAYGPFVMNTEADIRRAILDFNAGAFGQLD